MVVFNNITPNAVGDCRVELESAYSKNLVKLATKLSKVSSSGVG